MQQVLCMAVTDVKSIVPFCSSVYTFACISCCSLQLSHSSFNSHRVFYYLCLKVTSFFFANRGVCFCACIFFSLFPPLVLEIWNKVRREGWGRAAYSRTSNSFVCLPYFSFCSRSQKRNAVCRRREQSSGWIERSLQQKEKLHVGLTCAGKRCGVWENE